MAGEGLFAGVDALVGDEEGPPSEELPTVRTAIGGLVGGPTLAAAIGFLRCTAPTASLQPSTLPR